VSRKKEYRRVFSGTLASSEQLLEKIGSITEVISKVRQNLAEKRLLMSWKW